MLLISCCRYIDMLQAVQACPDAVRVPANELSTAKAGKAGVLAKSLRVKAVCADVLAGLLRLWSAEGKGILLLDEVGVAPVT